MFAEAISERSGGSPEAQAPPTPPVAVGVSDALPLVQTDAADQR
jgi:hypothetical protein